MTAPLQILSISDYERTTIYQTYTRESVAIVQQQRERLASSPFNVLAANQQLQEWSTKSHIMLPNYVLDRTDLLRQEHKRMYESPTVRQSYPALEKTEIYDATSKNHQEKYFFGMIVTPCPFTRTKRDQFASMLNAMATRTFKQPSLLPILLFQIKLLQSPLFWLQN